MENLDSRQNLLFETVAIGEGKASFLESKRDKSRDWLNPIAMSSLQRAVKGRSTRVALNGVMFSITYGIIFKLLDGDRECVKLKRTDSHFAPFGYVSIDRIHRFVFESDHDKQ